MQTDRLNHFIQAVCRDVTMPKKLVILFHVDNCSSYRVNFTVLITM